MRRITRQCLTLAVSTAMAMAMATAMHGGSASAQAAAQDCASLQDLYHTALTQAQACDAAANKPCAALRPAALEDACHCQVSVNPARTKDVDRLLAQYQALACKPPPAFCNRACMTPSSSCARGSGAQSTCGG
jgi:hypothetical protein